MRCPSCEAENQSDNCFCGQCGRALSATPGHISDAISQEEGEEEDIIASKGIDAEETVPRRRWMIVIAATIGIFVVLGLGELADGRYINAALLVLLGVLAGWVVNIAIKGKWEHSTVIVVLLLVLIPILFLAIFPWQGWYEEHQESHYAPRFVPYLTLRIENETHIIVDGHISNEGSLGGVASVHIKAYGGFPEEGQDLFGAFREGYLTTAWIAPGGTATVHWECTLSYFNGYGQVTWTVEPT